MYDDGSTSFCNLALVCAYAHPQCCEGMFSTMDGKEQEDEVPSKAAKDMTGLIKGR